MDGRIIAVNRAWRGRLGDSAAPPGAAIAGATLRDVFSTAAISEALGSVLGGKEEASLRAATATPGGARWWDLALAPHPQEIGALLVTAWESTEDVLAGRDTAAAYEALDAANTRLHLAQEVAGVGTWEWHLGHGTLAWSPEQFRLYGMDPRAAPPTPEAWLAMVHPDDRQRLQAAAVDGFRNAEGQHQVTLRLRRAETGEERWLLSHGRMVEADGAGRPMRILGVDLDVTDRMRTEHARRDTAEAALRERERFMRDVLDSLPEHVAVLDERGVVIAANAAWEAFGRENGGSSSAIRPGIDYLAVCRHAVQAGDSVAALALSGLEAVLAGWRRSFALEYPCHAPDRQRWYLMHAERPPNNAAGAVLSHVDITDHKLMQAALLRSEARYRTFVEASSHIIWTMTADGQVGEPIPGWERYTGQTREQTHGLGFLDAIHPQDRPTVVRAWHRALAREDIYEVEYRLRRHDDVWRDMLVRGAPVRDPATGQILEWIGTCVDITDSKAAAAALAENEARLRRAQRIGRVGGFEIDLRAGVHVGANRRSGEYMAIQGLAAHEAEERHADWVRRLHPEDRTQAERRFLAAIADDAPDTEYAQEYRIVTPAGEVRWIAARAEIERDKETGRALRMLGAHVDVTALKIAETALAENEALLRLSQEAGGIGGFMCDLRAGIVIVTEGYRRLFGLQTGKRELSEAEWAALVHPEDRARAAEAIRTTLTSGATEFVADYRIVRPADGAVRHIEARARCQRDEAGELLRVYGVHLDVTERKAADAALRESEARFRTLARDLERRVSERTRALSDAARELQAEMRQREEAQTALLQSQKLEALGQLTSSVAHDFNNLLAGVQGSFQLLERHLRDNPKAAELVRHGLRATERGARLISQLMTFARKEELQPRVIDLADLLRGAADLIRQTAGSLVQCDFAVAADAWRVIADPVRLETVLLNLTANARDAMPHGGTLTIAARDAVPGEAPPGLSTVRDWLLISMADTGVGMDADTLRRAPEPFFTTKPPGRGTGLGLASAYDFARQSGGALRLRSAPAEGTTVEIFLPRAGVVPATEGARASADARHGSARILVVDDDDGVRPVTAGLLADLGYDVVQAPSAEAAEMLALTQGDERIDMLVTDVVMSGAAGPVLAARLRVERPDLPVLFITGNPGRHELGDTPVLLKPFTGAALADAVLRGLRRLPG